MIYRILQEPEINRHLFYGFIRRQKVDLCWRRSKDQWIIKSDPFTDDWDETDYSSLIASLKETVLLGGAVFGAFENEQLTGFASVPPQRLGSCAQYLSLENLFVSEPFRGNGVGTRLFLLCADWAREHGGKRLYISAHSAVETQAFYRGLGCIEAQEYSRKHVEKEPFDCQLEYPL